MDILVVGGGGREHAIIMKLKEKESVEKIYALPGNGGIAMDAECFPVKATDIEGIVAFAKKVSRTMRWSLRTILWYSDALMHSQASGSLASDRIRRQL